MKPITSKFTVLLISATIVLTCFAGCSHSYTPEGEVYGTSPTDDKTYLATQIIIPEDIGELSQLCYYNGKLYFSTFIRNNKTDDNTSDNIITSLYTMNTDGTDISRLYDYIPGSISSDEVDVENVQISGLCIDNDGYLWVAETGNCIRKLNETGSELYCIDLSDVLRQNTDVIVRAMVIDSNGNIYLNLLNHVQTFAQLILVVDIEGNVIFSQTINGLYKPFIKMPDGSVAIAAESESSKNTFELKEINTAIKALTRSLEVSLGNIPEYEYAQIFSGDKHGYDFLISTNTNVYGFNTDDGKSVELFSWTNTGTQIRSIQNIIAISEEEIICTDYVVDVQNVKSGLRIYLLNIIPHTELPVTPKTELILVTVDRNHMWDELIAQFSLSNSEYTIRLVRYANSDNLYTELLSGFTPDIIDTKDLPYVDYARGGWLVDLYPFIDADPEIDIGDFVKGVLQTAEINNGLYKAIPFFSVMAVVGRSSVIGEDINWTFNEFVEILQAHPEADYPLGRDVTKLSFLSDAIMANIADYINFEESTANFDNPEFIQLLEFCKQLPDERDGELPNPEQLIAEGRQIMVYYHIEGYKMTRFLKYHFGGDISLKRFPSKNDNGGIIIPSNSRPGLAISGNSQYKEGAWEFIRLTLLEDWQTTYTLEFPTNSNAFTSNYHSSLTEYMGIGDGMSAPIELPVITLEDRDRLMELISSACEVSGLYTDKTILATIINIINEDAADYFNGLYNAEETTGSIQGRISLFLSEHNR